MSGITSTLNIAETAIKAQQYGLNITGHNISNVNNPDYSRQSAEQKNRAPTNYAGFLFGTGVDTEQIRQSVDQLLENRLTGEFSSQAKFEEAQSYMKIIEADFDEESETSMGSLLSDFWNSWQDLSDNPGGSSERVAVYEKGKKLSTKFNTVHSDLDAVEKDITNEISSTVTRINSLTSRIADMNQEILSMEINRTANDQRDKRNAMVDELGKLINIDVFEQGNGAAIVNAANGNTIVSGVDTNKLSMNEDRVMWQGSQGNSLDISDNITGGRLAGWLEIRDEVIPKYQSEINALSRDMIWAVNQQHSQGAGLDYFSDAVAGDYKADEQGLFSSLKFGDKIDYTKDFTLWTKDRSTADTKYRKTVMDMGLSESEISDWQGTAMGGTQGIYKLTVMDDAVIGKKEVGEADGTGLATVLGSSSDVSTALDEEIAGQELTVYGSPSGTRKINVRDEGGDAKRSSSSIARSLDRVEGMSAYSSSNSASFDVSGITNAEDGDEVKYSLYVDGFRQEQSFVVDSEQGTLEEQFEESLLSAAEAVNEVNEDQDLSADELTVRSEAGKTLGIQDFEVQDNAGVSLGDFSKFNDEDTVQFSVESDGSSTTPTTSTQVEVDLNGVDVSDQAEMASAFSDALSSALADKPFTVENDVSTNSVILRTTDGSKLTLKNPTGDTGEDASLSRTPLSGTDLYKGDNVLDFTDAANDDAVYEADTSLDDEVIFSGRGTDVTVHESTAGINETKAAAITGTVTIVADPDMSVYSDVSGPASGGLFYDNQVKMGSSILTLGGENGFSDFTQGETVSFDIDGNTVKFTVPSPKEKVQFENKYGRMDTFQVSGGGVTELQLAKLMATQIGTDLQAEGAASDYQVLRTGKSVSVLKSDETDDPIEITNFAETDATGPGNGDNATLKVSTGTGIGTNDPVNDRLESGSSYRDSSTSSLYDDTGVIKWEKYDTDGYHTGNSGLLEVSDKGRVAVEENGTETLSFNLSAGSLVAGNTLTLNTDETGTPDPLDFTTRGSANSVNDMYHFQVVSGGKVGHLPDEGDEPLTIEWSNSVKTGTFTIEGSDPPLTPGTPVEVEVDGMTMKFSDGTLFKNDSFTVTTDESGFPVSTDKTGKPTGEKLSDWHWTLDSFADRFNSQAAGMKASFTLDKRLKFEASEQYYDFENIRYSGKNGFSEENVNIDVKNWEALDFKATDLTFSRSSDGFWGILNDPTGGNAQMIPEGGDDDGFGVDFSGDGLADIELDFNERISGEGRVKFDLNKKNADDISFAFSDDAASDAGLAAAAGINHFFKGYDAQTMEMNQRLEDTKYIAAASIDSETGRISEGDNANALALSNIQSESRQMNLWDFSRGSDPESSLTTATFDDYYSAMIGSMGIKARSVQSSKEFADIMVNNIKEQRDSVSSVSLDEEMVNLTKYQHAFSAASKLLTVSDEMLKTLISVR